MCGVNVTRVVHRCPVSNRISSVLFLQLHLKNLFRREFHFPSEDVSVDELKKCFFCWVQYRRPVRRRGYLRRISAFLGITAEGYQHTTDPDKAWEVLGPSMTVEVLPIPDPFNTPRRYDAIRVVCISDTHGHHDVSVPDGEILIHAGDFTKVGSSIRLCV